MIEAVFCTAFFGFLRCGQFTYKTCFNPEVNLSMGDVKFIDGNSIVKLTLKASKLIHFVKVSQYIHVQQAMRFVLFRL